MSYYSITPKILTGELYTQLNGITSGTFVICSEVTVSTPLIINSGVHIKVEKGGSVSCTADLTINGTFEAGLFPCFSGTGSVTFGAGSVTEVYPEWFGAMGNGITDDSNAIQKAIDASKYAEVKLQKRSYRINSGLVISRAHTSITGSGMWRNNEPASIPTNGAGGATQILFYGTGVAITIGAEDLVNSPYYDSNWYGGAQNGLRGCRFSNFSIRAENQDTAYLWATDSGSSSKYLGGSTAIWDWYNGSIVMTNVMIEHFEQGFVGVQSDINEFYGCEFQANHIGVHIYKRTDQNRFVNTHFDLCDVGFLNDGARGTKLVNPVFTHCGSSTTSAVTVTKSSDGFDLENVWFENQGYGSNSTAIKPWISAGVVDGYSIWDIIAGQFDKSKTTDNATYFPLPGNGLNLRGAIMYTPNCVFGGADPAYHVTALLDLGLYKNIVATGLQFKSEQGQSPPLEWFIESSGFAASGANNGLTYQTYLTTSIDITLPSHDISLDYASTTKTIPFKNNGTGTPNITCHYSYNGDTYIGNSNGKLIIENLDPSTAEADRFSIHQSGVAGVFQVDSPTFTGGQTTRLLVQRSYQTKGAMPTTGTWAVGDIAINAVPSETGSVGSKYIILGWMRMTAGSNHVLNTDWKELRCLTGV